MNAATQPAKTVLKPLHWLKLDIVGQGSLWAEAEKSGDAGSALEIDMLELEALFSMLNPNAGKASKVKSQAANKPQNIQLIGLRRAYNCEIMLSKVTTPLPELMEQVLNLDDSAMDMEQVEKLIKFCPTKKEMELLNNYKEEHEMLGKCEQFFLELMKVPRAEEKLVVFSYKLQFNAVVSELRYNLDVVYLSVEQIRSSVKLRRVMQTILSLGNALNQGTTRGAAVGFKLDSLLKLNDTYAASYKTNFMHYLCKVLADKLPELLDFSKELGSLEPASKIQLKLLGEEMLEITRGLEKVVLEKRLCKRDGQVSNTFRKSLKTFLASAEPDVKELAQLYAGVGKSADSLIAYFGEDPAKSPYEKVIDTLLKFVRMFNQAHDENCKQIEAEKKAAQNASQEQSKAAEKERLKSIQEDSAPEIDVSELETLSSMLKPNSDKASKAKSEAANKPEKLLFSEMNAPTAAPPPPPAPKASAPPPPPKPKEQPPPPPPRVSGPPPPPAPYANENAAPSPLPPSKEGGVASPKPPSPNKPPMLSRTTTVKTQPARKLKPLHWAKFDKVGQGSLWAEAEKTGEAASAPEIDMLELETLFSMLNPNSDKASKVKSKAANKPENIRLINNTRAYNCEIMLSKVKPPLPELMEHVLNLDESAMDMEQVEKLIKFCPTKEEMELLKGYEGEHEMLGKCEQFFLELMKVPRSEEKLVVFSYKIPFNEEVSELRHNLEAVYLSVKQIRSSVKLRRVMQTILSLGNALNQGTTRGAAVGFKLDSLLKLNETRARGNKMTLMHYLCKVLADKLPELLDFSKEFGSLENASKIQLKLLAEHMQQITKGIVKVAQEKKLCKKDGDVSKHFRKSLEKFLSSAEPELKELVQLYSGVGKSADSLITYFGEDPAKCPYELVIDTLLKFVRMFNQAHDENCKRIEAEKKAAQNVAEQENSKAAEHENLKVVHQTIDLQQLQKHRLVVHQQSNHPTKNSYIEIYLIRHR